MFENIFPRNYIVNLIPTVFAAIGSFFYSESVEFFNITEYGSNFFLEA